MKHFLKFENLLLLIALIAMFVLQGIVTTQNPTPAINDFFNINLTLLAFALVSSFGIAIYIAFFIQDVLNYLGYDGEKLLFPIANLIFWVLFFIDLLFVFTTEQLSWFGTVIGLPILAFIPDFIKKILDIAIEKRSPERPKKQDNS